MLAISCLALAACGSSASTPKAAAPTPTSVPTSVQTTTTASTRDTQSQACNLTADAAKAAAAVHYANNLAFPTTFTQMLDAKPPVLEIGPGVQRAATTLTNPNFWKLTMTGGGTTQPTFVCTVIRPVPTIP